jgi:hypothetical protein
MIPVASCRRAIRPVARPGTEREIDECRRQIEQACRGSKIIAEAHARSGIESTLFGPDWQGGLRIGYDGKLREVTPGRAVARAPSIG